MTKPSKKLLAKFAPKASPAPKSSLSSKYAKATIVRFPIDELSPADYNPRTITDVALKGLSASLDKFGLLAPPVVNIRDGGRRLVGGHQRVKAALANGATEIDCVVVEFDVATERLANLTLNNETIQGQFVPEMTLELMKQIEELVGDDGSSMLSDLRLDVLVKDVRRQIKNDVGSDQEEVSGATGDDELPALSKSKAVSQAGVLYQLGKHRLYCGSLTAVGTLDIFGETQAECGFTYLDSKTEFKESYLDVVIGSLLANVSGAVYIATSTKRMVQVQRAFERLGGHLSNCILGVNPHVKGTSKTSYRNSLSPILYGWREGGSNFFYGDRAQGNVWTMKSPPPKSDILVQAVTRHIANSSRPDEVIFDPMLAHGATLIGAHKLNRRLVGYVSSTKEMDRIRKRWTHFVHGEDADWQAETGEVNP